MGAGAYVSAKSEKEVTEKERERKGIRKKQSPEEEKGELVRFYRKQGFSRSEAEAIAARVGSQVSFYEPWTIDGVRVDWPEGWAHIRASNTEPIMRVIAEAHDAATAEQLMNRVRQVVDATA